MDNSAKIVNMKILSLTYKRSFLLLFVLLATLFLTGCTQETPETTSENIRLQWWGVFLSSDVVQPLIDEYESTNSGVEIFV
jgi:ABC-type glycerol-3-phosphate transport system substrate-binding protein